MKRFIIECSADEFYTSHSGLALVGIGMNRFTSLNTKLKKAIPDTNFRENPGYFRIQVYLRVSRVGVKYLLQVRREMVFLQLIFSPGPF